MVSGGSIGLNEACKIFFGDTTLRSVPLGSGNINDTWLVTAGEKRTVLQRINGSIFRNPENVIANFRKVTEHINGQLQAGDFDFICPDLVLTREGQPAYCDSKGQWWRAQTYIDHVSPPASGIDSQSAYQLGRALATYHHLVSDLEPDSLTEVLPDFHNTSRYLSEFDAVCAKVARSGVDVPADCFHFVNSYRSQVETLELGYAQGILTNRVIHGDPKLDNVIFVKSGVASGLFDLDTVGSGLLQHDLGDCLRSACNRRGEYSDPNSVRFDCDICRSLLKGYGESCLTPLKIHDKRYIFDGVFTICFELGLRFLTDHLRGDVYFKVAERGDNLLKCRVQFALAKSILAQEQEIRSLAVAL
ncbi:phosphotransferase enzyme family protein [Desulfopila sp. IMCC35008]|uniref:phosphotransferase enzyme family protein n=1 Tax=Desulfopila sp. IMCC35008 TaxID=2653858 RepID=UPI0013D0BB55|nr:aminoglycoside phosphotransferase family protein [Desulfopila sp. IMCC35008]